MKKSHTIYQNDAQRDCSSHQDSDKEAQYSDDGSKSSDDILAEIGGRELKTVGENISSNAAAGKLDALESRQVEQAHPQQELTILKDPKAQALGSEVENLKSETPNIEFSVLASRVNERSQKQKGQKKQKKKVQTETKPLKGTAAVLASAHRLKKKERNMLTDVLVKYAGEDVVTTMS